MTREFTLASRTFLFSFFPLCAALIASFLAVHAATKITIKDSLKGSLYRSEAAIEKTEAEYKRSSTQFLAILTDNAGLKAAIGLLRETSGDAVAQAAVRRTIQTSLSDVGAQLDYDFLAVIDPQQRLVAAIVGRNGPGADVRNLPPPGESRLIHVGADYFEATTTAINLGEENLGGLTYGRKLDLSSLAQAGQIALIQNGRVLLSTLPKAQAMELETKIPAQALRLGQGREITLGGESYLALPDRKGRFGDQVQLLSLQSLDAAMAQFTGSLGFALAGVGAGGLLLVLILSAAGSRSTARPLTRLIEHLKRSGETGRLQPNFQTHSPVKEVNLLAEAFNRAAESLRNRRTASMKPMCNSSKPWPRLSTRETVIPPATVIAFARTRQ